MDKRPMDSRTQRVNRGTTDVQRPTTTRPHGNASRPQVQAEAPLTEEEAKKPTNMVTMGDETAPDRQPPRSPDHVVAVPSGGDEGAELVDPKLRREVAVTAWNDCGGGDDDDRTEQDESDDTVPAERGDDAGSSKADAWHPLLFDPASMSNLQIVNASTKDGYAALESGSESDFGASPGWKALNGSDGGGGEGLLDRMFSQECVQLTLDAHELLAEELSDVRRNLFPNEESMSSSSSSSSVKESKHKNGGGRGTHRPPTSLRMSIEKIREEASRVDAALALDQLETVQQELEETRRQLRNRRQELDEQRVVIKLKDDRLATLELERDLYKADATLVRSPHASKRPPWRRDKSSLSASTGSGSDASRPTVPRILERHPPPPLYEEEASCLSSKPSSDSDSSLDSSVNRGDRLFDSNLRRASALEARCLLGTKRLASILVARRKREKDRLSSPQPPDTRTEATTQPSPLMPSGHTTLPRSSTSSKMQGVGPRAPAATLHEEWVQNHRPPDTWSLERQMEDLQERLRASMETADELRRRLASIHGFYETTLRTLQARQQASERWHHHHHSAELEAAADYREEWQRAQVNHVRNAKRRVVDALEAKLREKDDEIERLSSLAYDEI